MKNIFLLTIVIFIQMGSSFAQTLNWSSLLDNKEDIIYFHTGYDFGFTTQIGYGKKLGHKRSIILSADASVPMGSDLFDDFKIRVGAHFLLYKINDFRISTKMYAIFRRHQTSLITMASFGSEFSAIVGYYKQRWHIAAELGFDKSIITHLKHSEVMRENYPAITDGWFLPSGGQFYYGIQTSKTIGNNFQLSLRIGATNAQFNDEDALLPVYTQLGLNYIM